MAPCNHKRYSGGNFRDINCVPNIYGFTCVIWKSAIVVSMALQVQKKNSEFLNQNVNLCL